MLGLKAAAGRALGVEREKHPWGGSGEGECQVQAVRGREAHLGSTAICHSALQLLLSQRHWLGGVAGAPPASSVYPGDSREETRL